MDKKLIKPNKFKETNKVKSYKSYNKTLRQKTMKGAIQILSRNVNNGFKPKYLIVGHFNDGNGNKRIQRRRLDIQYVERDLLEVKRKLLQILYGNNWETLSKRARCFFTIEYGKSEIKPHFNLLLEKPPKLYDKADLLSNVFNTYLPLKVRCLSKIPTKVDLIGIDNTDIVRLNSYIHKETNITNNTIAVTVNDYIRKQKSY